MAGETSFYWTDAATNRFASFHPDDEEIDGVDVRMQEVLAGEYEPTKIPLFDIDDGPQYMFRCGRFAVVYRFASEDPEIIDVMLWEQWLR